MKREKTTEEILLSESWRQLFDCEDWRVEYLLLLADDPKSDACERAKLILAGLRRADARAELCRQALDKEREWLCSLLATTDFAPHLRDQLPAFYVLTKQWDKYLREFAEIGHRSLIAGLSADNPQAKRMQELLIKSTEPGAVRLALELLLDRSLKTPLWNRILEGLSAQESPECRQCICEKWLETRNAELAKVIKKHKFIPATPAKLRAFVSLKIGSIRIEEESEAVDIFTHKNLDLLIEATLDRDPEITASAASAIVRIKDPLARSVILNRFLGRFQEQVFEDNETFPLPRPLARDIFQDHQIQLLERLAPHLDYRPVDQNDLVLFTFFLQAWDEYAALDPESKILHEIYQNADLNLRKRISDGLQASARYEWIVTVCGAPEKIKLSQMTDLDWQLLQKTLSSNSSWEKLWKLIPLMPASCARKFLQRLQQVSWQPENEDDKQLFHRLQSFSKRLATNQPPIWGDVELWKTVDIGGNLFQQLEGGAEVWESRFAFGHNGAEFFMLDRDGSLRTWSLPSCLPGRLHIDGLKNMSAIALSPREPVIAVGESEGAVAICDLLERRVSRILRIDEFNWPGRIAQLSFSKSGSILSALQKRKQSPGQLVPFGWNCDSWKPLPFSLPAYPYFSPNDEWLVYKEFNTVFLDRLSTARTRVASIPASFRAGSMEYFPDSSMIVISDNGRLNFYSIPEMVRIEQQRASSYFVSPVSDLGNYRIPFVTHDYCWGFVDGKTFRSSKLRPSAMQKLTESGVSIEMVRDYSGAPVSYEIFQILKDPHSQYFAIVHASGSVSFWVSTLFKFAQKPAALLTKEEIESLRSRLEHQDLSSHEMNWVRFILELSGSYEHYAFEIGDADGNSIYSPFDIEIA